LKDAPADVKAEYDYDDAAFEQTKLVVLSAPILLREAMALLEQQARGEGWPEYAQFECYACHHELKVPGWRQQIGYAGKPGRPRVRPWPEALVMVSARLAGREIDALRASLAKLATACDARPFGKAEEIASAAAGARSWADGLIGKLDGVKFDKSASLNLLRELCALAEAGPHDYDSARQIAWAFRVIASEWDPGFVKSAPVQEVLAALGTDLHLGLNALRQERHKIHQAEKPSGATKKKGEARPTEAARAKLQELGDRELAEGLRGIGDYDALQFRARFRKLSRLLPRP
jgi:hypothetical protein